jgi:uncharacterized protein YdhG (YjbR/CyaY superfamily)
MNEIDQYISNFPDEVQEILNRIRTIIKDVVPEATESMSYGMPRYKTNKKPLVYFAGYKNHVGLYATPSAHGQFSIELSNYKQGKGSVQFPINQPIPYELIRRIVEFKKEENQKKTPH